MKQKLFLIVLLIFSIKTFSQDAKVSLELNYPIPIDNNFLGENFTGIIDFGIDYRFVNVDPINIGFSFNGGILTTGDDFTNGSRDYKITAYLIQLRIFGELNTIENLRPSIGVGYTLIMYDASIAVDAGIGNDSPAGVNFNLGLAYDILDRLFVQAQYDFVKLGAGLSDDEAELTFNTNVNILKIGLGYRL